MQESRQIRRDDRARLPGFGLDLDGLVARCGVALGRAERPTDASEQMLLVRLALPDIFAVAERGVEDAALTVHLAPGEEIIARLTLVRMAVHRVLVHRQDPVDLVAVGGK